MRIAFISYEYPPETAIGGIGTYVLQISQMLQKKNIEVHVFCGSHTANSFNIEPTGVSIHRVLCNSRKDLRKKIIPVIKKVHALTPLSIIEMAEYGAEGLYIKKEFPDIPLIVKLHTPQYLVKKINTHYRQNEFKFRLKRMLGIKYNYLNDNEYRAAVTADEIITPSVSLGKIIHNDWKIPNDKIRHLPNPYILNPELLAIPAEGKNLRFGYFGRMEIRKGIINLTAAIPIILKKLPQAECWFIGADSAGPHGEKSMKAFMKNEFKEVISRVKFIDQVSLSEIPKIMRELDVCVYPSIWENFPNVCLEAMTAARGIVASNCGGMVDMLQDIEGGVLINPDKTEEIVSSIIQLLSNNEQRIAMGKRSREKIIQYYSSKLIDEIIEYYKSKI